VIAGPLSESGKALLDHKKKPGDACASRAWVQDQHRCSPSHPGGLHIRCWARSP